jgi:hypothetical protein
MQRRPDITCSSDVEFQRYGPIVNQCVFSADRKYRYLLIHRWEPESPERPCMWIALNPSIADESRLDNTLTRIRSFSSAAGFNVFYLVNLFALVSTDLRATTTTVKSAASQPDFRRSLLPGELMAATWAETERSWNS